MEIDVSQATCLGKREMAYGFRDQEQSICWDCSVPVVECEWLLFGKMYKGSKYFSKDYRAYSWGRVYIMVDCPKHREP